MGEIETPGIWAKIKDRVTGGNAWSEVDKELKRQPLTLEEALKELTEDFSIGNEAVPRSGHRPVLKADDSETGVYFLEHAHNNLQWQGTRPTQTKGDNFHNFATFEEALKWSQV